LLKLLHQAVKWLKKEEAVSFSINSPLGISRDKIEIQIWVWIKRVVASFILFLFNEKLVIFNIKN